MRKSLVKYESYLLGSLELAPKHAKLTRKYESWLLISSFPPLSTQSSKIRVINLSPLVAYLRIALYNVIDLGCSFPFLHQSPRIKIKNQSTGPWVQWVQLHPQLLRKDTISL